MSFFQSEFVQEELKVISELQEQIYEKVFSFATMSSSDKLEHVEMLEDLLKKQQILYTRMSLSDDPEAQKMKEQIISSARQLGFPPDVDLGYVFSNMANIVENMKKSINESTWQPNQKILLFMVQEATQTSTKQRDKSQIQPIWSIPNVFFRPQEAKFFGRFDQQTG